MSGVYIKQEISEPEESDESGGIQSPDTRTVPVPPTQRVMPSTTLATLKRGMERGLVFSHDNIDSDKVKKFLMTLITFSEGISASAGAAVKRLVDSLLLGSVSVPEFLRQLQLVTTFPVRPFVLPFLQSHLPRLTEEIKRQATTQGCSISALMANNEVLLETASSLNNLGHSPKANEIFHCDSVNLNTKLPGLKRKFGESDSSGVRAKVSCSQGSLISPPLFKPRPNLAMVPGYPHEAQPQGNGGVTQEVGGSQEDEWKNIKVMLNCISGMVEKTQRAISILQQRQTEAANVRSAEELVADIQAKATLAILEVKQSAVEEIKQLQQSPESPVQSNSKEEACWNCGRPATETCSGCRVARYCRAFCQHKDWEEHARVCSESGPAPALQKDRQDSKPQADSKL